MNDRIAKLEAREKPDAAKMIQEVRSSLQNAQSMGVFEKIAECHNIRRCLWANQTTDSLKHGDDAFPWDRALDSRVRVAEKVIMDHVRIRMAAIRSGNVQIGPENEVEDSGKAQQWDSVLKYYRNQTKRRMTNEMKLFFTCVEEFGYGVLHVDWHERKQLLPQKVSLDALMSFMAQQQMQQFMEANGTEPDDAMMQAMTETISITIQELLMGEDKSEMVKLLQTYDPQMPGSEARRVVTMLKRGEEATYYAPRSLGGVPCLKALIPWVNCLHGIELNASEMTTWMAVPRWVSEIELRLKAEEDEWNPALVEKVMQFPNRGLAESLLTTGLLPNWVLNGVGIGLAPDTQSQYRLPMYQIIDVYRVAINEAGVPAVYETTIHPFIPESVLAHECEEVPMMPFVVEAREAAGLVVQSRGIPELVQSNQIFQKKMKDANCAAAELAAFPPNVQRPGDYQKPQPGSPIYERQTGTSGAQSRFLDVPGVDMGALKAVELDKAEVDELFHRGPDADPDMKRLMMEELGSSSVQTLEEVVRVLWAHVQAYVSTVTASRIAGRAVSVKASEEDLMGTADINVEFSPMALNQKAAAEMAEWGTKLAALDRGGRIDFGAMVEVIARMYDPTMAERIVLPGDVAAQQVEDQEQGDIAKIVSGQLPPVRQGAEGVRLKKLGEWMQNPTSMQMMQGDATIAQRIEQRVQAYQFALTQRQNAVIGATGYDPSKDPVLGQEAQGQQQMPMMQNAA